MRDENASALSDHQIEVSKMQIHQKDVIGEEQHSLLFGLLETKGAKFVNIVHL